MNTSNNSSNFAQKLRDLVAANQLEDACILLLKTSEANWARNWLSRLKEVKDKESKGIADWEQSTKIRNQITDSILLLADDIANQRIVIYYTEDYSEDPDKANKEGRILIHEAATEYLSKLKRVEQDELPRLDENSVHLFLPKEETLFYTTNDVVIVKENKEDKKPKISELVSLITIENALEISYKTTGVISVRSYLRAVKPKPTTVTVQALGLSILKDGDKKQLLELINKTHYGKNTHDRIWIEDGAPNDMIGKDELLIIMNRRVGGWSGSVEDPRIELLLGGGSMPTVWNKDEKKFLQLSPKEVIKKEFREELKFSLKDHEIEIIGGFFNRVSSQLVILCIVFIDAALIPVIQKGALKNYEEKTDGIYLGRFHRVMEQYLSDATYFAGGKEAVATNFPSIPALMKAIDKKINEIRQPGPDMEPGIKRISELLKEDPAIFENFTKTKLIALELMQRIGLGIDWPQHLDDLDKCAFQILKPELSEWDIKDLYCLSCSIYLHRIGLIGSVTDPPDKLYEAYSSTSKDIILKHEKQLHLISGFTEDIAWIIFGHRNTSGEERSIDSHELKRTTSAGKISRQKISFYLKISSSLSTLNISLHSLYHELFFTNKNNSLYHEFSSIQAFSGISFTDSGGTKKILLKIGEFSKGKLTSNLKTIMQIQSRLATETRRFSNLFSKNSYFSNWDIINIDDLSLSKQIQAYIKKNYFSSDLKKAIILALRALLNAKFPNPGNNLNGWGSSFIVKHEVDDYKDFFAPRVVNTAEVLLALANYKIHEDDPGYKAHAKEIIQNVILSFATAKISKVDDNRISKLEQELESLKKKQEYEQNSDRSKLLGRKIASLQAKIKAEIQFDPFTSLTNKIPTIRVNSIPILAFSSLLESQSSNFLEGHIYSLIKEHLKNCIMWICKTDSNPFDEKDMLIDRHIFQFVISMKSLIRSERYWDELGIGDEIKGQLYRKTVEFIDALIEMPRLDGLLSPYKAMILELLIFYIEKSKDHFLFNKDGQVKALINGITESLIEEIKLTEFKIWEETKDIIFDDSSVRDWTHITSVWAIEGLCQCRNANLLPDKQFQRLIETIPVLLLEQEEDGFFSSFSENTPNRQTTKFIYKTALYTHALNLIQEIL